MFFEFLYSLSHYVLCFLHKVCFYNVQLLHFVHQATILFFWGVVIPYMQATSLLVGGMSLVFTAGGLVLDNWHVRLSNVTSGRPLDVHQWLPLEDC